MPSSYSNNRRRRRPRRTCFSMAHTCIHGVPEQELTSKKMAAPPGSCPTGKTASLLLFLLSSCCFGRVAAVNFSAPTQGGQQMDDDQHQSDWNRPRNLLRINGNDRHDHRFDGTGLTDHRRSLRQFRHNNPTRSYHGREHEGSAAAAAKGEANGDRRPTAHAAVADSGQRGDDIFVHSNDEQSFQARTPRYPTGTGTGTEWEEQQREEETGVSELPESPELDLNKNDEENTRNEDRPSLSTSTPTHTQEQDQLDEQEQAQMEIRQHLELSTCLSTLNSFAALTQDAPAAGQSARHPTATTRPKHLITKQGILDLLSVAVSTATASADRRSSEIPIAEMRWTDLPLPLIMQYNYASCSSPGPSYERKDGICTAAGEGVALETIDPLQEEASTFDATRHKRPHRRHNNGGKEEQERIGVRGEGKSGRSVEWPLRMLCREVTNYAQELAAAAGPGDDTSHMSSDHLEVELHFSYVMSNVSYALFHSARSSRTGTFGSPNGLVGRIRQRAMLKQKLVIATQSVIRMFLGCSVSKSMEEEDLIPLLVEDKEVLRTTLMHRAQRVKVNVENAGKAEGYNKKRSRRGLELGANPGYRATRSSIYEASSTHHKETKGDAITRNVVSGHLGEASTGGAKRLENEQKYEVMGANDRESAAFGGCDFIISANVEKLQKISCQDKYSYGCALVESSVYVKVNQGSGVGNWTLSDHASAIRIGLFRAIEESLQSGLFQQLIGD